MKLNAFLKHSAPFCPANGHTSPTGKDTYSRLIIGHGIVYVKLLGGIAFVHFPKSCGFFRKLHTMDYASCIMPPWMRFVTASARDVPRDCRGRYVPPQGQKCGSKRSGRKKRPANAPTPCPNACWTSVLPSVRPHSPYKNKNPCVLPHEYQTGNQFPVTAETFLRFPTYLTDPLPEASQ